MRKSESNFLRELAVLLEKYNIDDVRAVCDHVQFTSCGEFLMFKSYRASDNIGEHGTFYNVLDPEYTIRNEQEVTFDADET